MSLLRVWFSFNGRINRSTFWLKGIPGYVCLVVVGGEVLIFTDALQELPWMFLGLLFWMVLVNWIGMAVCAKRWHDHDMSGCSYVLLVDVG